MNVLAIGAHFDDLELGCGGTLIKHVKGGDAVTMLVVTKSSYNDPEGNVIRRSDIAFEEGNKAASVIGAKLECLNFDTFMVTFDEDLTSKLRHYIEDSKIDIIYTHWIHDIHRDHHSITKSALMAGRHVPRFLMYRSNYYDSEQCFRGNFYSDITDEMETKIKAIKAYKTELERVQYKWIDFIRNQNANDGQKIGVKYAECFEVIRYLL